MVYDPPATDGEPPVVRVEWLGQRVGLRFRYADEITYHVRADLREIWVTWPTPYTVEDAAVYLLGPIFAYVLRARGVLSLHASAVVIGRQAAAFCGPGGAGKSTIAAAFAAAGHPVLSDDVVAMRDVDGVTHAYPAYGYLRLWQDSARALRGEAHRLPLLTPNWDKHAFPVEALGHTIERSPMPLGWVFLIADRADDARAPSVERLRAADAFMSLVANTAANYLLTAEQRAEEFTALAALLRRVPVFRLTPHADPGRMDQLVRVVEAASGG